MSDHGEESGLPSSEARRYRPSSKQWTVAGIIIAFVVGVMLFKVLKGSGLGQTSMFYIGIPAVLALVLTLSSPSKSVVGLSLKVMTVFLLLSIPVLGEGFVCVIFAAPIFYLVTLLVAVGVDSTRKADRNRRGLPVVVLPALVLAATLEGVTPALSFDGLTTVSAHRTVDAEPDAVAAALESPLDFAGTPLRGVLAWGFPAPQGDHGSGLSVGDHRSVMFDGAHHRNYPAQQHHWSESTSQLDFVVTTRSDTAVRLAVVSDTTPISSWLSWQAADITWQATGDGRTEITWSLTYKRELAPAFYFAPVEKFVTARAAQYLVDAIDFSCSDC